MKLQSAQRFENVIITYDDAAEFSRALPDWLRHGWRFYDARTEMTGGTGIRVQYQRETPLTTGPTTLPL